MLSVTKKGEFGLEICFPTSQIHRDDVYLFYGDIEQVSMNLYICADDKM